MLVAGLKGLKVIDVACGSGDAQTLAVTENGMWSTCCLGSALRKRRATSLVGVSFGGSKCICPSVSLEEVEML